MLSVYIPAEFSLKKLVAPGSPRDYLEALRSRLHEPSILSG